MHQGRPPERWGRSLRTWLPVALGGGATILVDKLADARFGCAAGYQLTLLGGTLNMRVALVGGCYAGLIGGAILLLLALARWRVRALRARLDARMERDLPAITFGFPTFPLHLKVHLLGLGFLLTERLSLLWRSGPGRLAGGVAAGGAAVNVIEAVEHGPAVEQIAFHLHAYRWTNLNVADAALLAGLVVVLLRQRRPIQPSYHPWSQRDDVT